MAQGSQGQKYVANLFFGGVGADIDPELLDSKTGAYLEAHCMQMSRTWKNVLEVMRGDKSFGTILPGFLSLGGTLTDSDIITTDNETITTDSGGIPSMSFIGGCWLNGYVVTFYRDLIAGLTYIYANSLLIAQHEIYPSQVFDCDTNSETWEIVITDNVTVPIVLNLQDMLAHIDDKTYFDDYDYKLYSVNKPLQINQPVFVQLEDLGAGGGLRVGSYAYSIAYSSKGGESTPWGPTTPYIPVPESAVTIPSVEGYTSGIKTWGGETSLTPGRYGIRLKLRIANLSGFDYIKVRRYANNTGQPISYTPTAEFIILTTDSFGSLIDIKNDPYSIIEFTDSNSKAWAILDDSVSQVYSTIKTARTARFYDRRIVLGGITYESKLIEDKDIFITEENVNRIAFPIVKILETGKEAGGFSNIYNQVFNKSHRLGEKYGFAAEFRDEQENTLFAVPLKMQEAKDDFTNFQFPNRRDKIPAGVKRVDTIVLSGSIGSANILCDGVTETVVFHNTLTQTAALFVLNHAADYIGGGVIVTSYLGNIIFTSLTAGVDFTGATSITTQVDGDLTGSVITTQANVVPVRQVDQVMLTTGSGYATITCQGVTRIITSTGDIVEAIIAFVTDINNINAYAAVGVAMLGMYPGGIGIQLTGPVNGAPITTTAFGSLVLAASPVITSVYPVLVRQRIDTVTFSPLISTIGAADITCSGITRTILWDRTWYNTIQTFLTNYAPDYLPFAVASLDALHINSIIFTGSFTGVTSIVTHITSDLTGIVDPTQPNISGSPQIDLVYLKDIEGYCDITCQGVTRTVDGTNRMDAITAFVNDPAILAAYVNAGVTPSMMSTIGIAFTGVIVGTSITTSASGTMFDYIENFRAPSAGVAQIDTITLSGTVGNAWISCNAMTRGITFVNSLTDTATKFYNDYASVYAAIGVSVTNSGSDLIFEYLSARIYAPPATTIVNAAHNLTGAAVVTQAASPAVRQVDIVTLLGLFGTANITCQGVTRSVTFNISPEITAHNFYDNFYLDYAAVGVTVSFTTSGTIIFTGPASGTSIVTTATGSLVDSIYTTILGVYGVAQIDKVTVTGSSGNVIINCNAIFRGVAYTTSPTGTASQFVIDYAADYLPSVGVTSSGADIFFTKLTNLGVSFIGTTAIVHSVSDLTGTVVNTTANASGGGEVAASTGAIEEATVLSWNADDVAHVYDPVAARRLQKQDTDKELNIISVADPTGGLVKPYAPITPTGRGSSPNQNNYDDILQMNIMDTVDGHDDRVGKYGSYISTVGLRIGGIDVTKLPSTVKSFSIVRTPAAGRVVCQGIGMYALNEMADAATDPSLTKALNKLWFYSPEIDSVIGNKGGVYEDIKNNPGDYQIQLVAPCGFFSDFYNSLISGTECALQDFVSLPICGAEDHAKSMFAPDYDQSIGRADYISFGKWRNTDQGAGIDATLTFDISSAQDVPHAKVRVPYLELTLDANIYYTTNVKNEACTTAASKAFHEPWYIINIIQSKEVPNNNVNSYNDIGHSIRLESIVGIASGEADQQFPLVEERREDVLSTGETASTYRYIWVDGLPWLESHDITALATHLTAIEAVGYCTPSNGLQCYGIFTLSPNNIIVFDKILPISGTPVAPVAGSRVVVKYNNNSPIDVFLGDTYIADASFLAIDTTFNGRLIDPLTDGTFRLEAPMPHYDFELKTSYHQARAPMLPTHAGIWDDVGTHHVSYIRQWLVGFTCESTVNIPMAYKNFYPNRLYAMRPFGLHPKLDTESLDEYFTRIKVYAEYNDDYPDEYLNWNHGGLSTPASVNFDYEKSLSLKVYAEPQSGSNEFLSLMKRLHWSTQRIPGFESNKVFVPTNIYDLKNDKASQISILYDQFSERGSNLYVITDRGAGMLLVDKQMITTAEGNNLAILSQEAGLIKGEVWLSDSIGCPGEFWRGKSEGAVKLPNNIVASILVFPSQDDIVMLTNNNFVQIADNMRQILTTALESIDLTGDFSTRLYSVIDRGENRLWITIGDNTYTFNFDQNNWDGSVKSLVYDKSFNAEYLEGTTEKNTLVHAINTASNFGLSMSHKGSNRFTAIGDVPYVVFSVTPELGRAVEFLDMFISASNTPYSIQYATDRLFTDSVTVLGTTLQEYKPGLYYLQGLSRSTVGGKRMQGKTLFVKISFPDTLILYNIKLVKVGYQIIAGN